VAIPDVRRTGLHGRQGERDRLASVIDAVCTGGSGVLVLRGPAGIGKSTLLDDAVRGVADVRVLRARGVESEVELAYAALHQLLHPVVGHVEQLPGHQRRALRIALGLEQDPDGHPAADRFLVALAVLGVLAASAEEAPVVCLVDDAQWLDQASAATLLFVARRLGAEAIGVLLAVRDPDLRAFPVSDLPELQVEGLDVDAAGALLTEHTGAGVDREVCGRLVEWTGGNPLALSELPSVLSPEHLAGLRPLPSPLPLPRKVERLYADRVRRLPDEARTILLVAAAEDSGELTRVLAAAHTLGLHADALELAERSGLVAVAGTDVAFPHPLVRSAVYHSVTAGERRRVHLALRSAADEAGDVDRRAWHAAAAALAPDEAVVGELEQAAARACGRGGFEAAGAAMERAADLTADGAARCRRLRSAAEYTWMAGHLGHAARLLEAARPLAAEPLLRADIGRLRGWIEFSVGSPAAARHVLMEAARDVAPIDSQAARRMLGAAAESAWLERAQGEGAEIRRVMSGLDPPADARDSSSADLLAGFLAFLEGDAGDAVQRIAGTIRTAEERAEADMLVAAAQHAFYVGDDDAALRLSADVVARSRATGKAAELLFALPRLVQAQLLRGQWTAAAAGAAEAVQLARGTGQPELSALPLAWLTLLASLRGARGDAGVFADQSSSLARTRPLGVFRAPILEILRWARATDMLISARPASAFLLLDDLEHPVVTAMAALDRVQAAVQSGHRQRAQHWLQGAEVLATATGAPWALAMAAHCRALLSEGPVAWDHFAEALRHHEQAQRPFERARAALAYGEALRRSRRRVDARTLLGTALDLFDGLDASAWAERTRSELRACGQTLQRRDPSAVLRLTPQEVQVARFVASGLPTRAVAEQLFLSPRTVDFHLRNVFTKLGISSRSELAVQRFA
jgi:DNA-binding CsgD family transcriptional regulator